jgi:hypothetical protein
MPRLHSHAPAHLRETFLNAVDAYLVWRTGQPEPTVIADINYVSQPILISEACKLLWRCTDILPGTEAAAIKEVLHDMQLNTYAAAAQAMRRAIVERRVSC